MSPDSVHKAPPECVSREGQGSALVLETHRRKGRRMCVIFPPLTTTTISTVWTKKIYTSSLQSHCQEAALNSSKNLRFQILALSCKHCCYSIISSSLGSKQHRKCYCRLIYKMRIMMSSLPYLESIKWDSYI